MSFNLEKFFNDIFKPARGEVVTIMYDIPHDDIEDNERWEDRRAMVREWHDEIVRLSEKWGVKVNPAVVYEATGCNNGDLPEMARMGDAEVKLHDIINSSTIILAMPQFSATAPLYGYARESDKLRVGSMPGVARLMQDTGLAADYASIAEKCRVMAPVFRKAEGIEVEFSTGHRCYFDLTNKNPVHTDDGILHPERAGSADALSNLPAGEVFVTPNEGAGSKTKGELPIMYGDNLAVCTVEENRITHVSGEGENVERLRKNLEIDPAWRNIAEVAIGCNDSATVCGIILQDEKAGFHWAYGRSDHFGGSIGVKDFTSPDHVIHEDVVYAKESPVVCKRLDMIFPDGSKQRLIVDGVLQV